MAQHDNSLIGRYAQSVNTRKQQLGAAATAGRTPAGKPTPVAAPRRNALEQRIFERREKRRRARAAAQKRTLSAAI